MISIDQLQCPVTSSAVSHANAHLLDWVNSEIEKGQLFDRLGEAVDVPVDDVLTNKAMTLAIPVRGGIPNLIPDRLIPIDHYDEQEDSAEPQSRR